MRLLRYGEAGQEKPGILDADGKIRDLSGHVADLTGDAITPEGLKKLAGIDVKSLPLVSGTPRLGCPIAQIGKIICVGLNYSDHAAETGMAVPPEPIIFMKATTSIIGPNDTVIIPKNSKKTDWEVELGIVIGKKAQYVDEKDSLDHVAGYCVVNDISEREFQIERSGQWVKGKSADTFAPIGPWMVTKDEIADPQNLKMWLDVDGKRYQDGSTTTMVYGVKHLVSYISQFMTLMPGDVIPTGTPPGVGTGMKPPVFLKPGNVMHLGIEGLGEQRQNVVAYKG
ncbi:MAG: fumarylacetoacetate hydrolase family protein [Alphaproteobacteria bacterium]|nr:fumarylacetoacetate hydrolase family protein [Alphaproteobacteria bacterium]MBU0797556.1 fumarylacetoacetate hydrolase family protein [Alphaproteobacteria bacterium]MBU0885887.1 fumarylacetoacetate hydrolase family protein [Alphaproteobacteria bacterium]MBU1814613.1 fumarylacetoacetate hydrolase family protein [Alphaproteobacteria bacterium]MBU2089517.1 fumarylacetoacetate hydrolase family protein [Alphaproteobacteria bacterium]